MKYLGAFSLIILLFFGGCQSLEPIKTPQEVYQESGYLAEVNAEINEENDRFLNRGSGSVIEHEGKIYVLTAAHVASPIEKVGRVWVKIKSESRSRKVQEMEIAVYDKFLDFLVLKFKDKNFKYGGPVLRFGSSEKLRVGDTVMAIGSQSDVRDCLTSGSVINLKMTEPSGMTFILHTAIVNPGSSGGPLVNNRNEMVGMNVRIYKTADYGMPIAMAVPADHIKRFLPQAIENKEVNHWILDLDLRHSWEMTPIDFKELGIHPPLSPGVIIAAIPPLSLANIFNELSVGDQIIEVDGNPVMTAYVVYNQTSLNPNTGKKKLKLVELKINRYGYVFNATVPLSKR